MSYGPLSDTGYVPGKFFNATRGLTKEEWETRYGKSMPVSKSFIQDKGAANRVILVCNLSSSNQTVVIDRLPGVNRQYGNQRFNEREIAGVCVERGRTVDFPLSPRFYIFTIGEYRIGLDGKRYYETALGAKLNSIANTLITVFDGPRDGALDTKIQSNMEMDKYFTVENSSDRIITVRVVQESATASDSIAIAREKESRKPDLGPKVIEEKDIKPGGKLHYKHPPQRWEVRALDDYVIESTSQFVVVPPMRDYVENASTTAELGDAVLLFDDDTRDGGVVAYTYASNNIKFVSDDMVITGPKKQ